MSRLYSQLELIQMIKLPPTTVKRWLVHFSLFIPTVKIGDSVSYKYETLTLLKRIKALRVERYHLGTIVRILIEEGFPLYHSEADKGKLRPKKAVNPVDQAQAPLLPIESENARLVSPRNVETAANPKRELAQTLRSLSEQVALLSQQIEGWND